MSISKKQIKKMAKLANLKLTNQEVAGYTKEAGDILDYVEELQELNTKGVQPTAHAIGLKDATRKDEPVKPCFKAKEEFFKIKKILQK